MRKVFEKKNGLTHFVKEEFIFIHFSLVYYITSLIKHFLNKLIDDTVLIYDLNGESVVNICTKKLNMSV